MKYRTILIDPPWPQKLMGKRNRPRDPHINPTLPYSTMTLKEIAELPIDSISDRGCHLWLWTTNQFIREGFDLIKLWGFKYLTPIHWIKPSGCGNYFISRSQTILFGYRDRCKFNRERYLSNVFFAAPRNHSQKPEESYKLIERISSEPRLELFARDKREGWHVWGNEVQSDVVLVSGRK